MPIFQIKNKKLLPIKEERFNLEKELQTLAEENLQTLFGLEFISSEFEIEGFYIDTLAYDLETKSFIILEYKRGKNFTVVDQGLHYLSLLLNNKANFVLEFNHQKNKKMNIDDFDWSQIRIIFIARAFSQYQQGAINFRDFPIELWEIVRYDDGLVDLRQIQTTKRAESITKIVKDDVTTKIARQVKTYTLEDHIRPHWIKSKELFEEFSQRVLDLDPRIQINPVKFYVGFKIVTNNVIDVKIRSSKLVLGLLRVRPKDLKDPENKTKYRKNSFKYFNKHITEYEIKTSEDIDYAMVLVKQVYNKFFK